jgi:DNA-binding NarL/FixJ family response regulator
MPISTRTTSVLVVDDHRTFAELLALAVDAEPDLECVGVAEGRFSALEMVAVLDPAVVVMDVQLEDGDGLQVTEELLSRRPDQRVVVLTAFVDDDLPARAAEAGAVALLRKDGALSELLGVLRSCRDGGFRRLHGLGSSEYGGRIPRQVRPLLTQREQDVLQMLAAGFDAKDAARELGISLATCRGYVKALLAKLGAHSQLEAVVVAMRYGLVRAGAPR